MCGYICVVYVVLCADCLCIRFFVALGRQGLAVRAAVQKISVIIVGGITISNKELQINEEIRDKELRVIGADGEQIGVMDARKAQSLANEKGLDLVKIAPQAKPPVCKIMDYGKYKFELAKREKENRKNQKVVNIKEVQLSPSIDTNDFNTKCNHAIKFLKSGDKVKVTVRFRGRELSHSEIGETLLARFAEQTKEYGNVERPAKLEGRNMTMFLAPTV